MKERISSLDFMKVVAAFFVIYIHIPISGMIGSMLVPITRVAVPFFFMISGYFLWDSDPAVLRVKIKNQIKHVLFLTVMSNLLFFIWKLFMTWIFGDSIIAYLQTVFSVKSIFLFLVLNASPFSAHLWYLGSYLYVLVIFYCIVRWNGLKKAFFLIPVLLISDLVLGKYSMLLFHRDLPNELTRNFLFVGIPYFLLGILFSRIDTKAIFRWNKNYLLAGYVLFSMTSILEKHILMMNQLNATRDHYLGTTLAVVCVFLYALQNPSLARGTLLEKIGRRYSLTIYIIHPIFILILDVLCVIIGCHTIYRVIAPFAVFATSLGFAALWRVIVCRVKTKLHCV